jgi:hypothetical protein
LAPHLFIPLGFILLAEWVVPAMTNQRILSPAFVNDFVWYLATIGVFVVVNGWVAEAFHELYQQHLGFLTVGAAARLPVWLVFVLAVLISDFLGMTRRP